jgi:hypothetical protein
MNFQVRSICRGGLSIFGDEALRKSFCVKKKFSQPSLLEPDFAQPGTDTDNKDSQSECTEEQEKCARRRRIRKSKAQAQER